MEFGDLLDVIEKYPDKIGEIQTEYMYLLSTLTLAPDIESAAFLTQVKKISRYGSILIIYEESADASFRIFGCGTLIVEPKLIHSGMSVGHIEDVVVHPDYRKRGISGKILDYLKRLSVTWNCYKIILDCAPSLKAVYEKSGFRQKSISMAYYVENEIDMALHTSKCATALIPPCPYVGDIIKRNGFVNSGDNATFIYFKTVQGDIPFADDVEQEKICEIQGILEKGGHSKMARVLYIVNVFDVVQKYKIISNQNVVFLYITTISQIKGSCFEWEKDNSFLDKIIQSV